MVAILDLHKLILSMRESMLVSACDNPFCCVRCSVFWHRHKPENCQARPSVVGEQ